LIQHLRQPKIFLLRTNMLIKDALLCQSRAKNSQPQSGTYVKIYKIQLTQ
jgi:hypothetical protein